MNLLFPILLIGTGLYFATKKAVAGAPAAPNEPSPPDAPDVPDEPAPPDEPTEEEEPEEPYEPPTQPDVPNPFPPDDRPYSGENVFARYCDYVRGDYDTTNGGCLLPDGRKVDGARLYNGEISGMPGGKGWFE